MIVVLYQFTDREGSTFALSPASRRELAERFPLDFHPLPRLFVAHNQQEEPAARRARLAKPLFLILTGLGYETTRAQVEFRDAVTEELL